MVRISCSNRSERVRRCLVFEVARIKRVRIRTLNSINNFREHSTPHLYRCFRELTLHRSKGTRSRTRRQMYVLSRSSNLAILVTRWGRINISRTNIKRGTFMSNVKIWTRIWVRIILRRIEFKSLNRVHWIHKWKKIYRMWLILTMMKMRILRWNRNLKMETDSTMYRMSRRELKVNVIVYPHERRARNRWLTDQHSSKARMVNW